MTESLKIVVVEDEPISLAYLKNLIKESGVKHEILAELDSVAEGLEFFNAKKDFDLIFMDIHLGDGTCFELLDVITIEKPIIFCTTFDSYAIEAFKYNSVDYLMKPVKSEELNNAINKYQQIKLLGDSQHLGRMQNLMQSLKTPEYKKRFLINHKNQLSLLSIDKVTCFYSEDGYTYLVDTLGKSHHIDFTLDRLEELVNPKDFHRINRKVMVSIDYIQTVGDYFNNRLKIKLVKEPPVETVVSRNRVRQFKIWLKGLT